MTKIKVYRYKAWDVLKDCYIIPESMATREYISARKPLQILEESEIEIDSYELDIEGKRKVA